MRMRVMLSLCLALLLAACSGGGFLPLPTPPPTATPRPRSVLLPAAAEPQAPPSPSPSPTVPAGPAGAPEIVAGLIPAPESERYVDAVNEIRARDEVAGDWLLHSGLLLRDGRLDAEELQVLDVVLAHTEDDPLWYLSHLNVLDGVSAEDVEYLQANDAVPGTNWFFGDDISGLQDQELLSLDGQRSLQRIFDRARHDAEVRRGLYLINTLGLPRGHAFQHPVPAYNDQLYLLARLLERGVPGEYEKAATAAALTYGSLFTLVDEGAREQIVDYATERVRFLIDTDVLLAAAGAQWRAIDYPLEMLMVLLWGGQANAVPQYGVPLAEAQSLSAAASAQPLTSDDLSRILLPMAALREMQDEMLSAVVERTGDEALAAEMLEEWWSERRRDEADDAGPDPGRQWARLREGRGFAGGAEAAYVLSGLAASINLPLPWAQLWLADQGQLRVVPYGLWLDPATRTLRLGTSAQRATADLPAEATAALVAWRPPWDNWHLAEPARSVLTVPLPLSVWRSGVPSGYLLRASVAGEADILAALGVEGP